MNIRLIAIFSVFVCFSCGSLEGDLVEKWWYEERKYGDDIIMFTEKNKILYLNDDDIETFEVNNEKISITNERGETIVFDLKIEDDNLTISSGNKSKIFRICEKKDYLIGDWKGFRDGVEIEMEFNKKREVEVTINGDSKESVYTADNNTISVEGDVSNYTFSDDKNTLTLSAENTEITLIRDI
tara:strand:+ start:746 stop:1297 length:552 start_codon:yes stop_codon:yes gene_type:complete